MQFSYPLITGRLLSSADPFYPNNSLFGWISSFSYFTSTGHVPINMWKKVIDCMVARGLGVGNKMYLLVKAVLSDQPSEIAINMCGMADSSKEQNYILIINKSANTSTLGENLDSLLVFFFAFVVWLSGIG